MLKRFVSGLASPGLMLLCGAVAAGYVAMQPAGTATAHERYLCDRDPGQSLAEDRARSRAHRAACPTCRADEALTIVCQAHRGSETGRVLRGLYERAERPLDHVRRCTACRARPIS